MTIITTVHFCRDGVRLTFGVPLEDVFPYGDLHPSLKNLFATIFESLSVSSLPIGCILTYTDCPECIYIEKALTLCQPIDYMHAGSLMWMLRHFLGSLPLPLLPKFTNDCSYVWLKLSDRCKSSIQKRLHNKYENEFLYDRISEELLKLPPVNLLLIGYLVNFLRSLVLFPNGKRINQKSAQVLINYFSPSIFVRPYKKTETCKRAEKYHPLMLFLLLKWPQVQMRCMEKHPQCFVPVGKRRPMLQEDSPSEISFSTIENNSTQTSPVHHLETIEEDSLEFKSTSECRTNTDSFASIADSIEYLVDATCQTDNTDINYSKVVAKKVNAAQTQTDSTVDGSKISVMEKLSTRFSNTTSTQTSLESQRSGNSYVNFEEYFYDDYDLLNKLKTPPREEMMRAKNIGIAKKVAQTTDIERKISTIAAQLGEVPDTDTFKRNSKSGWSYTPKSGQEAISEVCPQVGWKVPKANYKLFFDEENRSSAEQVRSSTNVNNLEFTDDPNPVTPLTKSKKSLINLGKMKSDIVKIFKDRKVTGSASEDQISSKVKYKKMNAARSTIF